MLQSIAIEFNILNRFFYYYHIKRHLAHTSNQSVRPFIRQIFKIRILRAAFLILFSAKPIEVSPTSNKILCVSVFTFLSLHFHFVLCCCLVKMSRAVKSVDGHSLGSLKKRSVLLFDNHCCRCCCWRKKTQPKDEMFQRSRNLVVNFYVNSTMSV